MKLDIWICRLYEQRSHAMHVYRLPSKVQVCACACASVFTWCFTHFSTLFTLPQNIAVVFHCKVFCLFPSLYHLFPLCFFSPRQNFSVCLLNWSCFPEFDNMNLNHFVCLFIYLVSLLWLYLLVVWKSRWMEFRFVKGKPIYTALK